MQPQQEYCGLFCSFTPYWEAWVAVGTVAAVIVALKDYWIPIFVRPKIVAYIQKGGGNPARLTDRKTNETLGNAHYFHLLVRNIGNATARKARVIVNRVDQQCGAVWKPIWYGPMQAKWMYQDTKEYQLDIARKSEEKCDAFYCDESGKLYLALLQPPNNLQDALCKNEPIRVFFEVQGEGFVSIQKVIEIRWNGNWSPDREEFLKNITVRHLSNEETTCVETDAGTSIEEFPNMGKRLE